MRSFRTSVPGAPVDTGFGGPSATRRKVVRAPARGVSYPANLTKNAHLADVPADAGPRARIGGTALRLVVVLAASPRASHPSNFLATGDMAR
jgi:hypothetical protein